MIPRSLSFPGVVAAIFALIGPVRAEVVINEIVSAASERNLQWDATGTPKLGTGLSWYQGSFNDASWRSGPGPFGFGTITGGPSYGTNLATQMQYLTPSLYLRKSFTVSVADAARTDQLLLTIDFNDGFVCYVNGVEVARRWAGPGKGATLGGAFPAGLAAGEFIYHDQPAYNPNLNTAVAATSGFYAESISLGAANARLVPGMNVIAIHALNIAKTNGTFLVKANVSIAGSPAVPLVNATDTWNYLPGVVEPSGNLYDPALLFSGKLNVPWGTTAFDDEAWGAGAGPIRAGSAGGAGTLVPGVINQTPSIYARAAFNVTAAQASDPAPLQLLVDYDDGFVAYVNGLEVARANVGSAPNTFTPHTAVANATRNNGTAATYSIDPPTRLLKEGINVLAVQVHNVASNDPDLYLRADLLTSGGALLVPGSQSWKYLAGVGEPVTAEDTDSDESPEEPDYANDWLELHNNGPSDVSLAGWRLTDDAGEPNKWFFPAGVTIPAGGFLVVFCDGENTDLRAAGGYLHTNFKLSRGGDYLALRDTNGVIVQDFSPGYPRGSEFHSFGRSGSGGYVYFDTATPAAANGGTELGGFVAEPVFNIAGGFYAAAQSVTLSCATTGATIRFTTDGSEPTLTNGTVYSGAISVTAQVVSGTAVTDFGNRCLRARAFKTGLIPSRTVTNNIVVGEAAAKQSLPAIFLSAHPTQALHRPFGIFAIYNNDATANYTGGVWHAAGDRSQFFNPGLRGRFAERPGNMQLLFPSGAPGFNTDVGLRCAGSPYSRPRYTFPWLTDAVPASRTPWASSAVQKPQVNTFFRSDLGVEPLVFPLFPGSAVTTFDNLRLRAGKNDISNPFVRDELMRRLSIDTGNVGAHGINTTLWVNGVYKGYYNLTERLREDFFQRWYGSSKAWDVWVINDIASGDNLALQETVTYLRNQPQSNAANYEGAKARIDVVNFVDYLCTNLYGCTGDWPHNNYTMARERSSEGKWVFAIWDAEGSFGSFGGLTVRSNQFSPPAASNAADQAKIVGSGAASGDSLSYSIRIFYTLLRSSPEFKMLFADRLQKHFFNNGALTNANILARKNALRAEMLPLIPGFSDSGFTNWIDGVGADRTRYTLSGGTTGSVVNSPSRRTVLFSGYYDDSAGGAFVQPHLVAEGLFPGTLAPTFASTGNASTGFQVTMTNPNAGGTIYYTTNGADPRAVGGNVQGAAYTGAVAINQTAVVKARVRNSNSEWSPLTESIFVVAQTPAVLITEIMYHPLPQAAVEEDEFEFLELKNVGATTASLNGWELSGGVSFTFPPGTSLGPGAFAIVVKNASRFASRYPGVNYVGSYTDTLDNGGDLITVRDLSGAAVASVTYDDAQPWPALADGYGNSLVPVNPNSNAAPNNPASWRASSAIGGSPGADDPTPTTAAVLVNEVLANSPPGTTDKVELFNPTAQPVDIGGWFLSDNPATPKKYRIADGTVLPGNDYLIFSENHFNDAPPLGSNILFAFDSNGEDVRLSAADAAGNLTGYAHGFSFDAAAPAVSFGRHVNSAGAESFPAQKAQTFGSANAGPLIGPVVLSELMYYPASGGDEFVELRNISAAPVPLFDPARPANAWKIAGIGFTLPAGITLQPGQMILITPLSEASWRSKYGTSTAIGIYGPYPGNLGDTGERVTLQMPGVPYLNASNQTVVPFIDVDSVRYDVAAPWPTSPLGTGPSLERRLWSAYADDFANWRASPGVGGSPGLPARQSFTGWRDLFFSSAQLAEPITSGLNADPDGDGFSNFREFAHGLDPLRFDFVSPVTTSLAMDGAGGPFLTIRFRRSLAAENVSFLIDTAAALDTWSLGSALQLGTAVNNGDGTETVTFRDTVPSAGAGAAPQRFIRLRLIEN